MHRPIPKKISTRDIVNSRYQDMTPKQRAELPKDYFGYNPQLYKELIMPSYVHGYSLAIEYMKQWFLKKFTDESGHCYFKEQNVNVNGRHVLHEWKHFNKQNIKREKPMLAIVPTLEFDYDRELLDAYMGDRRIMLHKSDYQQSFFKDYEVNSFIYCQPRALRMNFNFKIRVGTRAEQLDLWNKMEIWFRIGATEHEYISADFHIPHEVIIDIAKAKGFRLTNDGEVENTLEFLSYLNKHSDIPIIFKMRAINQKPEYFMRMNNLYTNIETKDKIQLDDGEKEGRLDTNFHIEMQCNVMIPIPHFYVFFNQKPITHTVELNKDAIGYYTINAFNIPPENKLGWQQKAISDYMTDPGDKFIDLHQIFDDKSSNMCNAMRFNLGHQISPASFIEVDIYRSYDRPKMIKGYMDYASLHYIFDEPIIEAERLIVVVYADNEYINKIVVDMNNYLHNRIDDSKL